MEGASFTEEGFNRHDKRRSESGQSVPPKPVPRTSLLQNKNLHTGSVGCLASSPREAWTSPKSFRSFLEQREAALSRRSRGPSLGSIDERSSARIQNNEDANQRRNENDYRVLEQKVIELQDQVEEMQLTRLSYENSTARLAGFLSGFASQLSQSGENVEDKEWCREGEKWVSEKKNGGCSYSVLPRQVNPASQRPIVHRMNIDTDSSFILDFNYAGTLSE